jgi:hypothetical protein
MFILGIAVFHEPFDLHKLIGFVLIWAALVVYWVTSARATKTPLPPAPTVPPQAPPEVPLPTG